MDTNETTQQTEAVESVAAESQAIEKTELMTTEQVQAADREVLLSHLKTIVSEYPQSEISSKVKEISVAFEAKTDALKEQKKAAFLADGGEEKDFDFGVDIIGQQMKEELGKYYAARKAAREAEEKAQVQNALAKRNVIKNIADLMQTDISANRNAILEHIRSWKTIGPVPRSEAQEINTEYKRLIDDFFKSLNEFRELRELDFKHNLKAKTELCEQAEALAKSDKVKNSYHAIRELQKQWKAIGRVRQEEQEEIWQRFKTAADAVYDRYRKFEATNRSREEENYKAKQQICEELETLMATTEKSRKSFDQALSAMDNARERWKKIGFAPKEVNDEVYSRFRKACDAIHNARRAFFKEIDGDQKKNLAKKTALCEKAEAVMNGTDWRKVTSQLVELQRQWKAIGQVPRKDADAIWARFRKACDTFFDAKEEHFNGNAEMVENLEKKKALIEELKKADVPADVDEHFRLLQQFQQRWNEIGFVPIKEKAALSATFSNMLNERYDKLNTDDANRNLQRFKARMELAAADQDGQAKVEKERQHLLRKLKQLEQELTQLQNNVGFFAQTENAQSMVAEVNRKIKLAQQTIDVLNEKLDVLDSL